MIKNRNIKLRRSVSTFFLAVFLNFTLAAQTVKEDSTLVRTIIVENEYTPEIMDADKINSFPDVQQPEITKKKIEYTKAENPLTVFDTYRPMDSFAPDVVQPGAKNGYLSAGYGNYGNTGARAGYRFRFTQRDRLDVAAFFEGMKGKLDFNGAGAEKIQWNSRYYRSSFLADYEHLFSKVKLGVSGNFSSDVFNYHPYLQAASFLSSEVPFVSHQHHTKGAVALRIGSFDETLPFQMEGEMAYRLFSQKYLSPNKENILSTYLKGTGKITENQIVSVSMDMKNLFYTSSLWKNRTALDLLPVYDYRGEDWRVRIGAQVSFSFGMGKTFRAAPDIKAEYIFADSYVAYLTVGGGRYLTDLRRIEEETPYMDSRVGLKEDLYLPLDAALGIKANPFSSFWFDLRAGYQVRNNDFCYLSDISQPYTLLGQADFKIAFAEIALKYNLKDYFRISIDGTYYHWKTSSHAPLTWKPELKIKSAIEICPFEKLSFTVGYEYIRRTQAEAINDLNFRAVYTFWKDLSAFADLNNLMNKNYQRYYGYPAEKFNFLAGLSLKF